MKKTSTYIFIFVLIVVVFILFLPKNEEREVNLGNGYYYIPFQEVMFDVTGFGGNGIYMYKNNLKVPIIFSEIEEYKFDSTYIIIKQRFDLKTRYLLESMIFMPGLYFEYDEGLVLFDKKYLCWV